MPRPHRALAAAEATGCGGPQRARCLDCWSAMARSAE